MVQIDITSDEELKKIDEIKEAVPFIKNATDAVRYALSKLKLKEVSE